MPWPWVIGDYSTFLVVGGEKDGLITVQESKRVKGDYNSDSLSAKKY